MFNTPDSVAQLYLRRLPVAQCAELSTRDTGELVPCLELVQTGAAILLESPVGCDLVGEDEVEMSPEGAHLMRTSMRTSMRTRSPSPPSLRTNREPAIVSCNGPSDASRQARPPALLCFFF